MIDSEMAGARVATAAIGSHASKLGDQSRVRRSSGFHGSRVDHDQPIAVVSSTIRMNGRGRQEVASSLSRRNTVAVAATASAMGATSAPKCHGHLLGVRTSRAKQIGSVKATIEVKGVLKRR
jgi:hypothetical protein